jgi:hypothetical protein
MAAERFQDYDVSMEKPRMRHWRVNSIRSSPNARFASKKLVFVFVCAKLKAWAPRRRRHPKEKQ